MLKFERLWGSSIEPGSIFKKKKIESKLSKGSWLLVLQIVTLVLLRRISTFFQYISVKNNLSWSHSTGPRVTKIFTIHKSVDVNIGISDAMVLEKKIFWHIHIFVVSLLYPRWKEFCPSLSQFIIFCP